MNIHILRAHVHTRSTVLPGNCRAHHCNGFEGTRRPPLTFYAIVEVLRLHLDALERIHLCEQLLNNALPCFEWKYVFQILMAQNQGLQPPHFGNVDQLAGLEYPPSERCPILWNTSAPRTVVRTNSNVTRLER